MPQKPTIEPTDRSMPPLRITNVMPIARIALMATCLTRIDRLPVVRNSGDEQGEHERHDRQGDERAEPQDPASRASRDIRLSSSGEPGSPRLAARRSRRRRRQRLAGHVLSGQIGGDPAAGHHDARESPRPGSLPDPRSRTPRPCHRPARRRMVSTISPLAATSTPRVGSSISSTRGRGHDAARDHDLLLVAAAERANRRVESRRLEAETASPFRRRGRFARRRQVAAARQRAGVGQRHVLLHVHRRHEPGRLAILGHHGDAPRDPFADVQRLRAHVLRGERCRARPRARRARDSMTSVRPAPMRP